MDFCTAFKGESNDLTRFNCRILPAFAHMSVLFVEVTAQALFLSDFKVPLRTRFLAASL